MRFPEFPDDPEHAPVSPDERHQAGQRSTWVSVWVNVLLSAGQMVVGLLAHSQALVADALHSLSDLVSDGVVLVASHHSRKDADEDHPYGHHRFETAASLALGLILLGVGGGMLWAAVLKLQAPDQISPVQPLALYVALVAIISKELLFRYLLKVATRVKSSLLVANAWHARSDAASSLVVALGIGGGLLGYPLLDPLAAVVVGLMVCKMGAQFAWEAMHDLTDRAVDLAEVAEIQKTLRETPGVAGVHDVRTRKMGDLVLVDAHLEVDAQITVEEGHDIAVEARRRVLQRHRVLDLMTHVDPWRRPDPDHLRDERA